MQREALGDVRLSTFPWRNLRKRSPSASGERESMNPITGVACCAWHAATPPRHPEHRKIPAAACLSPARQAGSCASNECFDSG